MGRTTEDLGKCETAREQLMKYRVMSPAKKLRFFFTLAGNEMKDASFSMFSNNLTAVTYIFSCFVLFCLFTSHQRLHSFIEDTGFCGGGGGIEQKFSVEWGSSNDLK